MGVRLLFLIFVLPFWLSSCCSISSFNEFTITDKKNAKVEEEVSGIMQTGGMKCCLHKNCINEKSIWSYMKTNLVPHFSCRFTCPQIFGVSKLV